MKEALIRKGQLIQITKSLYEIPKSFRSDMRVPAHIFINEAMLDDVLKDTSLQQIVNVATLPGIVGHALAMPDIHQGYGFPIGGVAAFDIANQGIISPGGIGYDINCGVRLLGVHMSAKDLQPYLEELATALFQAVPSGVGKGGRLKVSPKELATILRKGAPHMLTMGYGTQGDVEYCEEGGCMEEADPDAVSDKAKERGLDQLGTLGSGNHFLEVQEVADIYDEQAAQIFGITQGMVVVMIHCGSRGLGHQNCTEHVRNMLPKLNDWGIILPDKELACAPFTSAEGQAYYSSMCASANFAWANRHLIGHYVRTCFEKVVGKGVTLKTIYDLSHNMGKKETHIINGKHKELIVHRKGATRAFPAGRHELPSTYTATGHPVLIPGTMGTSSYILVGTSIGLEKAFGSSCHGAGRRMSRVAAKKTVRGSTLRTELEQRGIIIRCESDPGLAEEAPIAYKDVDNVVTVIEHAGLARRVARVKPLAVIKGG